jgi:hypothetical protein
MIPRAVIGVEKSRPNKASSIYCPDRLDRAAQMTALTQIIIMIIDPCCRTIERVQQLLQKEWCDVGHVFAFPCGHRRGQRESHSI